MITLGVVLLVLGLLFFHPLFVIGVIIAVIGLVFFALSASGRSVGGRNWY